MKKIYLFLFLVFSGASLSAQTPACTIGTGSVCAGEEVLLPVMAYNMYNIGAITLLIGFDFSQLQYLSVENRDPQLNTGTFDVHLSSDPQQLIVTWSDITGINFQGNRIFDIKLIYNSGNNPVIFNEGCEFTDASLNLLNVTYVPGYINNGVPFITGQPFDTAVMAGTNASFHLVSSNTEIYQWEASTDNGYTWIPLTDNEVYSGCSSDKVIVHSVPVTYSNNLYRCRAGEGPCALLSAEARLTVKNSTSAGNKENLQFSRIGNHPNPFRNSTTLEYTIDEDGFIQIQVFDVSGRKITELENTYKVKGTYHIIYNTASLFSGPYFCRLEFQGSGKKFSLHAKMIKE